MVRVYVRKSDKTRTCSDSNARKDEEVEDCIRHYYAAKEARRIKPLADACGEFMAKTTLKSYTDGYATADAAVAAFRARRAPGHPTILSKKIEDSLYATVVKAWRMNLTLSKNLVMALATVAARTEGKRFKTASGVASSDWLQGFRKRYKLSALTCKQQHKYRSAAEMEHNIKAFFLGTTMQVDEETFPIPGYKDALETVCDVKTGETYRQRPDRILNADETNLVEKNDTIGIAPTGASHVATASSSTNSQISVFQTVTASGVMLPDLYVKEGKTHDDWLKYADPRSKGFMRADGYFVTPEIFKQMLPVIATYLPGGVSPTNRALFVVDGHSSRLHPDCHEVAKEHGFDLFILPGSMTAILQPCDQLFGPIKRAYRALMHDAKVKAGSRAMPASVQIKVWTRAKDTWSKSGVAEGQEKIKESWKKLGLYPCDMDKSFEFLANKHQSKNVREDILQTSEPLPLAIFANEKPKQTREVMKSDLVREMEREGGGLLSDDDDVDDDDDAARSGGGRPVKKKRRVNYPGFIGHADYEAYCEAARQKKEKIAKEIEEARLAREERAAKNKADKEAKSAAFQERKRLAQVKKAAKEAERARKRAEKAAAKAAKEAPGGGTTRGISSARSPSQGASPSAPWNDVARAFRSSPRGMAIPNSSVKQLFARAVDSLTSMRRRSL